MSDIEKAMCFIQKSRPEDILYFEQLMQPLTYEVLEIDVLQTALDSMVCKHAILRTGFDLDAFAHIIYKEFQSAIVYRDLRGLGVGDQKRRIESRSAGGPIPAFRSGRLAPVEDDRHPAEGQLS